MTRPPTHSAGFTLLELLTTVSVAAIVLAFGVPAFSDIIRNNRLSAAGNDLLRSTQLARSEAIKRQAPVVVCATDDANEEEPACSGGDFTQWVVFVDTDADWAVDALEPVLERHAALHPSLSVRNDQDGILSYGSTGFASAPIPGVGRTTRVVICDQRGNQQIGPENSAARAVVVEATGRVRVTKARNDVTQAIGVAGGCP